MGDEFAYLCIGILFIAQGQTAWRERQEHLLIRWIGYLVMTVIGVGALYLSGVAR